MEKEKILQTLFKSLDPVILKYKVNSLISLSQSELGFEEQKHLYKLLTLNINYP